MPNQPDGHRTNSWLHATAEKEPESSAKAESGPNQVRNFGLAIHDRRVKRWRHLDLGASRCV
ncbi:MAG: hypothetical protein LC790_22995, partial [Actinobacteria bacterium]|nr:hypothetical protein [Actinomycetota bacterium]